RPGSYQRRADARTRGRRRSMGVSRGRHDRRREVRCARLPEKDPTVSYTLRGRIESRLAAVLVTLAAAAVLAGVERTWWPLELAALMAAVGVTADVVVYDRLLDYQPGWLALPLGAAELALAMICPRAPGVSAPLGPALALFAGGWLVAQVLGHAVLPLVRLT